MAKRTNKKTKNQSVPTNGRVEVKLSTKHSDNKPRRSPGIESPQRTYAPRLHCIKTDDEVVGINKRFKGLHDFIELHPKLEPLASDLLSRLCEAEPALSNPEGDTGWPSLLYLRSSFSTDLHPLYIASRTNKDSCQRYLTARQNWFSGLHPLPKVLDALYGRLHDDKERQQVRVDLDFSPEQYNGMRAIPIMNSRNSRHRVEDEWTYQHVLLRVSRDAMIDSINSDGTISSLPVFNKLMFSDDVAHQKSDAHGGGAYPLIRDFEIWNRLFHSNSPMSVSLIGGAARLCALLGVPANLMMFRAVAGGVFSLWRYPPRRKAGDVITTLLCRPRNAAAVSAGLILFGRGPKPGNGPNTKKSMDLGPTRDEAALGRLTETLRNWTHEVENMTTTGRRTRNRAFADGRPLRPSKNGTPKPLVDDAARNAISKLIDINPGQPNTRYASPQIGEAIARLAGMQLSPDKMKGLGHAICRLLERAILLSDTTDEGRPVSFGIMLGDPFHVRYWPGARPSPIAEPTESFSEQDHYHTRYSSLSIDRLRARVEYVSDPRLRCIVFPYFAVYPRDGQGDFDPSYVIDLSEFGTSVVSWPPSTLWSTEASTYAYLSAQCPGSIACLVGPGANVRVFANGDLVAYRNSREWHIRQEPKNLLQGIADNDKRVVIELLDLGAAMSSFHNPQRHGGFVVWTRDANRTQPPSAQLEQLHSGEPGRLFGGSSWITGRDMLTRREPPLEEGLDLNFAVAQQVLKASERDGAIWLAGETCTVKSFGMRVTVGGKDSKRDGINVGTKRRTAEDLVRAGNGETIAVTVSTDGPVRLWYLAEGAYDVVPIDMFRTIETNDRDLH